LCVLPSIDACFSSLNFLQVLELLTLTYSNKTTSFWLLDLLNKLIKGNLPCACTDGTQCRNI